MVNSRNREIQRKRMLNYFLEATLAIIREEGIDKVTARKVAKRAGYNQATLYLYFDNLNHLLIFTSTHYLRDYLEALPLYIQEAKNAKDVYFAIWQCFSDFAFAKADIYKHLFFSNVKDIAIYYRQYYDAFPLDIKHYPPEVQNMLQEVTIENRSKRLMDECVAQDFLDQRSADLVDSLVIFTFESLLQRVDIGSLKPGVARELFMSYMKKIFNRIAESSGSHRSQ